MALTVVSPAHEATGASNRQTLDWSDSGANTSYQVYFGTNSSEVTAKSVNVNRGTVSATSYDPRITLTYGATYYWLIVGVTDAAETGVKSFTVITEVAALPDAKTYSKKMCAASDNAFFYENTDSPPKMVELSGLTLQTNLALEMFELQQKVYIVNDDYLKVVDFVNTKLVLNGALTTPPERGNILTQLVSGATMVVDFVPKGTPTVIYGRTLTGTFGTGAGKTVSDSDTISPTDRYPTTVTEPTTPHYYDWEPYMGITDTDQFGSLPDRATMGCRYRGRACLSGNSADPHQWYQSRQANPYDWTYATDDSQSPVAGTDAEAGKVGDIITAQIPYSDDYMLYSSVGSLYVLRGDAADGGQLDSLNERVGIISPQAWCWDDSDNLYFLDLNGLYKLHPHIARLEPLTADKIPNFASDLSLNPNTQRITLNFDRNRHGLQVCVTEIETGTNSNYFYDLQAEGFFPETYPEEDGVMCSHFYNADDPENRKLLLGCWDGHIRIMDDDTKSDDTGSIASPTSEAIDSHVLLGPVMLGKDHDNKGKLNSLTVVSAGGEAAGSEEDSDDIDYEIYVADTAEGIIEKLATSSKLHSGTVSSPGKQKRIRRKSRGIFLGVRLGNNTAAESFGVERVIGEVLPSGRAK